MRASGSTDATTMENTAKGRHAVPAPRGLPTTRKELSMKGLSLGLAATALLLAACSSGAPDSPGVPISPVVHEAEGRRIAFGTFSGASGTGATGEVFLVRSPDGYVVSLGSDFALDRGSDPYLSLGSDDETHVNLGPLARMLGAQVYSIPADVDVADYDHVYIWSDDLSVPLGMAELDPI
jgi:hypothetical protein